MACSLAADRRAPSQIAITRGKICLPNRLTSMPSETSADGSALIGTNAVAGIWLNRNPAMTRIAGRGYNYV
jgi:hypothetical protein